MLKIGSHVGMSAPNYYLGSVKEALEYAKMGIIPEGMYNNLEYLKNTDERKVMDFIAGMTDDYFLLEYNRLHNCENFL